MAKGQSHNFSDPLSKEGLSLEFHNFFGSHVLSCDFLVKWLVERFMKRQNELVKCLSPSSCHHLTYNSDAGEVPD